MQTCPECGAKLNGDETNCPECGYPVGKKNATNIITENLDKITGAQSKSYVKFKDLFKNTFKKHTEEDLDEVFVCGVFQIKLLQMLKILTQRMQVHGYILKYLYFS